MRKPYEAILNGRFARSFLSPKECGRNSLVCRALCEGLSGDELLWRRHLEDDYAQLEGPTGPNGVLASYRQAPACSRRDTGALCHAPCSAHCMDCMGFLLRPLPGPFACWLPRCDKKGPRALCLASHSLGGPAPRQHYALLAHGRPPFALAPHCCPPCTSRRRCLRCPLQACVQGVGHIPQAGACRHGQARGCGLEEHRGERPLPPPAYGTYGPPPSYRWHIPPTPPCLWRLLPALQWWCAKCPSSPCSGCLPPHLLLSYSPL